MNLSLFKLISPWVYTALAAVLIATNAITAYKAYHAGADHVQGLWDAATLAATDKKLDVKGKQDAIQNAPVDAGVTSRRLRNGSF